MELHSPLSSLNLNLWFRQRPLFNVAGIPAVNVLIWLGFSGGGFTNEKPTGSSTFSFAVGPAKIQFMWYSQGAPLPRSIQSFASTQSPALGRVQETLPTTAPILI